MTSYPDPPPLKISQLLRKYNLHPRKGLGQNFLVDETWLRKIVSAGGVTKNDLVLEVGPGLGNLTRHLASASGFVVAVEIDQNLIRPLMEVLSPYDNVKIIQGDILELSISSTLFSISSNTTLSGYTVIANIPYHITSSLIRYLLEADKKPNKMVLTVQHEVAMRITAQPPDLSLLALSVQIYGEPRLISRIPAGAFFPTPKVDSAILQVELFPRPLIPTPHLDTFFQFAKAGFGQKRKTLRNSLAAGLGLPKSEVEQLLEDQGINPVRRAQTLDIEEWKDLTLSFKGT